MSNTKKILKIFFIYLLPLAMLINFSTFVTWTADYYFDGQKNTGRFTGFPFPDNGTYSMVNSFESTTNWLMFFINQTIILTVSFLIYFFILHKINFNTLKRTILLTVIVTAVYVHCGLKLGVYKLIEIEYNVNTKWPDKIKIKEMEYQNVWLVSLFK